MRVLVLTVFKNKPQDWAPRYFLPAHAAYDGKRIKLDQMPRYLVFVQITKRANRDCDACARTCVVVYVANPPTNQAKKGPPSLPQMLPCPAVNVVVRQDVGVVIIIITGNKKPENPEPLR